VAQTKLYATKLNLETTYSANGAVIYQTCMQTGKEGLVKYFLSPQEFCSDLVSAKRNETIHQTLFTHLNYLSQ